MEKQLRSDIEGKIRQILISELGVDPGILSRSSPTTPLLGRGIGLDSMETLGLVTAIEKEFDIQVADDDLTEGLFKNIATLAEFVLQKASGQKSRPKEGMFP